MVKNLKLRGVSVDVDNNTSATTGADVYAGGIAGKNAGGSITGSSVVGQVDAWQKDIPSNTTEKDAYAGGIVAHNMGSVTSSYARASVTAWQVSGTASLGAYAGGLVGYQDTGGSVAASFTTRRVDAFVHTGAEANAGGLIGYQNAGSVTASYSHARPAARTRRTDNNVTLNTGGLLGELKAGTVTGSFATGKPSTLGGNNPTEREGSLAAHQHAGATITNSYWDTTTSGITATGAGAGKTTSELQTPTAYGTGANDIYKDWNLDLDTTQTGTQDPWDFGTASQYPVLDYGLTAADQRASVTVAVSPTSICETTKGTNTNACGASPVTSATLTATISPAQEESVTLVVNETAAEYRLKSGSTPTTELTIAAGSTTRTLTVEAVNNTTDAPDNAVTLTPTTAQNWVAMPSGASLTIKDDDFGLIAPSFSVTAGANYTSVRLTWTRQPNATGNKLEYQESKDTTWTEVASVTSPHTISSLTSTGVYTFKLAATKTGYDDGPWASVTTSPGKDYDADDDGLIEITTLAQLNAVRWDLDGNGSVASGDQTDYDTAFPTPEAGMGCNEDETLPANQICEGYELSNSLDFDTNGDGQTDITGDTYWNGGAGWVPIGGTSVVFYAARFDGNGYEIENLFINSTSGSYAGLFGHLQDGHISNVSVTNVDITLTTSSSGHVYVGGLAGRISGTIFGSSVAVEDAYTTGEVSATATMTAADKHLFVGGLAGTLEDGDTTSSYSWADVTAVAQGTQSGTHTFAGGLFGAVGEHAQNAAATRVDASYAAGAVSATAPGGSGRHAQAGGLAGQASPNSTIRVSYARGSVTASAGSNAYEGGLVGFQRGNIEYSFATGKIAHSNNDTGGLVGSRQTGSTTASYYNSETDGRTDQGQGTAKTTSELQTPTAYSTGTNDIYKDWNLDLDTTQTGTQDPWDFGTANQYPALKYGGLTAAEQRPVISLTLNPTTIYERVGGATTSTVTITATTEWNQGLTVAAPQDTGAYTVGDVTIAAGSTSGTETLTAVNNYTDASNYSKAMTLGTHPAKISGTTTTTETWVSSTTATAPVLNIVDDDELAQVTGVTAAQEGGGIRVNWTKVTGATGYWLYWKSGSEVYDDARHVTAGDVATHLIPESGNCFTPGTTYTLMVQATKSGADYSQPSADATAAFKGWVVVSSTAVDVAEPLTGSTTGTYTVKLGTLPANDVTVTITRKAGTHQSRPSFDTDTNTTGDQATLTFTSSNGTTAQTVTISVTPDLNDTDTESTTLVHTATSTDANYSSITAPEVVARAVDGNAPPTSADITLQVPTTGVIIGYKNVTFSDPDNNTYASMVVKSLPSKGELKLSTYRTHNICKIKPSNPYCKTSRVNVSAGQEISTTAPSGYRYQLNYHPGSGFDGDSFTFTVKDSTGQESASYTVTLQKAGVPGKPTNFSVATDDGRATLSWTKPADPQGDPVTKHQVRWMTKNRSRAGPWTDVAIVQNQANYSHTFTGLTNNTAYSFKVRAVNDIGTGAASGEATATPQPVPSQPTNLTASAADTTVTLGWDTTTDTAIDKWQYRQKEGSAAWGNWADIPNSSSSTNSMTLPNLDAGTVYYFRVRAVNTGSVAGPGLAVASTATTPLKPTGLAAVAGFQQAALSWNDPQYPSITVWQYRYKSKPKGGQFGDYGDWTDMSPSDAGTRTFTVTGLTSETTYAFQIRARNPAGDSPASDDSNQVKLPARPGEPQSLTATKDYVQATKDFRITLDWSLLPPDPTIIRWQWRGVLTGDDLNAAAWTDIPGSDKDTRKYILPENFTGAGYQFQVRAFNTAGGGVASSVATVTLTPAKTTLSTITTISYDASTQDFDVTLTWAALDPVDPSVSRWEYRAATGDADTTDTEWTTLLGAAPWKTATDTETAHSATSHVVEGLAGKVMRFQVRAVNRAGDGPASNAEEVTLTPDKPVNFVGNVTQTGASQAKLTWKDPQDASIRKYQYRTMAGSLAAVAADGQATLYWRNPNDSAITKWQYRFKSRSASDEQFGSYGDWTDIPCESPCSVRTLSSYVVTSLTNGTTYTFQVRAVTTQNTPTALGKVGSWSIGNVGSAGEITLKWPSPSDSDIVKWRYRVRVLPDTGEPGNLAVVTASRQATLYWVNPNDPSVTRWQYRQKTGPGSFGNWTNIPCSSPCAARTQRSYTVTGLTDGTAYTFQVRAVKPNNAMEKPLAVVGSWSIGNIGSNGRITLDWANPNNSFIAKYQYRQRTGTGSFGSWMDIPNSSSSTTSYRATGLTAGTKYAFEIRGVSQNDVVVTTVGPWSFTAFNAGNNQTTLTWGNPNNSHIVKYQYRQKTGTGSFGNWTDIPGSSATTTSYTATCAPVGQPPVSEVCTVEVRPVVQTVTYPPTDEATVTPPNNTGWKDISAKVEETPSSSATAEGADSAEASADDAAPANVAANVTMEPRTEHTVTGLERGQTYSFQLRAVNTAGAGPSTVNQLTTANVAVTPQAPPRNFAADNGTELGTARLTWDDPAPPTPPSPGGSTGRKTLALAQSPRRGRRCPAGPMPARPSSTDWTRWAPTSSRCGPSTQW